MFIIIDFYYWFYLKSVFCINISNRGQLCKINNYFSQGKSVLAGVPQVSILGPLLFNIFINDIFVFPQKCEFANYADDSTIYSSDKTLLNHDFSSLSNRFYKTFYGPQSWYKCFLCYLALGTNLKGISYLTTVQLKIAKKKITGNHFW